jgi:protein-S-isoprenylcysteine O-methyltransferase Ste14
MTGGTLMASFVRAFAGAGTPVSPYSASTTLVTTGPYRISRNPAYLGMALVYAGIAVSTEALWALAPLPAVLAVIDRGVIAREERYLERRLGDEYRRYTQRTRRWL